MVDFCITQLAQGPSRTCNANKEEEEEGRLRRRAATRLVRVYRPCAHSQTDAWLLFSSSRLFGWSFNRCDSRRCILETLRDWSEYPVPTRPKPSPAIRRRNHLGELDEVTPKFTDVACLPIKKRPPGLSRAQPQSPGHTGRGRRRRRAARRLVGVFPSCAPSHTVAW